LHVLIALWLLRRARGRSTRPASRPRVSATIVSPRKHIAEIEAELLASQQRMDSPSILDRLSMSVIRRYIDKLKRLEPLGELLVATGRNHENDKPEPENDGDGKEQDP